MYIPEIRSMLKTFVHAMVKEKDRVIVIEE